MSAISENIKFYRNKNSLTQAQLADKLNVSEQAVYNWERGSRIPRMGYIEKMAELFHVESPDILKVHKQPTNMKPIDQTGMHPVRIPIIGTIACGTPILAEQNIDGYTTELFDEEPEDGTLFALKCQGDSMEPKIPNGATVIVRLQRRVGHGDSRVTREIYLHVTKQAKKELAQKLDKIQAFVRPTAEKQRDSKVQPLDRHGLSS